MAGCLPGADDAANIFIWHGGYDEQDASPLHTERLNSLLAVIVSVVDKFDPPWILQRPRRRREADAVLGEVGLCLRLVPFIIHAGILPDTRITGNVFAGLYVIDVNSFRETGTSFLELAGSSAQIDALKGYVGGHVYRSSTARFIADLPPRRCR
jgi:hypothetical protein